MNFASKLWKKSSTLVRIAIIFVIAILIHVVFIKNSYKENFGNPSSCTYYHMTNCGHCKRFTPEWDKFVSSYKGPVKMRKVEMNDAGDDLNKYNINGFPTVLVIDENGETKNYEGPRTKDGLMSFFS